MNKKMGKKNPPILLKDEYNKIIDNDLVVCNFCIFFYATYTQDDGKMPHNNKLSENMEDNIFLVVMILNPYYINFQIKALPDWMVYPTYY